MHWEKEIRIRITLRRVVGTILAASTVANLIIAGAAFGADSPPTPTITSVSLTSPSTSTASAPAATAVETLAPALTHIPGITPADTPGITPTDTFTPTYVTNDSPGWFCIKKFYWPTYYIQPGDRLSLLAFNTGSSVKELMAANCLTNERIYAGQRLYVPRLFITTVTYTATATETMSQTLTPTHTSTSTSTDTPTPTHTATATQTPTDTSTSTSTETATVTSTLTHTNTPASPTTAPNSPPIVSIISPTNGSGYKYTGFNQTLNLWYSVIELQGYASDQEDDVVHDSSLFWSTDFKDPRGNTILGTGNIVSATLYSNVCTGIWHTITLTAEDSQGAVSTEVIRILIGEGQLC